MIRSDSKKVFKKYNEVVKFDNLSDLVAQMLLPSKESRGSGFVYLFYNEKTGFIKVGRTGNLLKRARDIREMTDNAIVFLFALDLKGSGHADNMVETILHNYFIEKRMYGEWFSLSIKDVFDIMNLKDVLHCNIAKELKQQSNLTKKYIRVWSDVDTVSI